MLYPDLNGVWVGTTRSNWPIIARIREAAAEDKAILLETLSDVPLQEDALAIQIKVSLFRVQIIAALSSTDGRSYSLTSNASRDPVTGDVHLVYIYRQDTPQPKGTDESSHLGAAELRFNSGDEMRAEGDYWTRRRWREGMNTAGQLDLRLLDKHIDPKKQLRDYAIEESNRSL